MIFHQGTTSLHVSLMTRKKLLELGWEVLIHLLHLPGIASSDFHLFCSLQNSLNGKCQFPGSLKKPPATDLGPKREDVLGQWNYEVALKIAESNKYYALSSISASHSTDLPMVSFP